MSPGGSRIYRHDEPSEAAGLSHGDPQLIEAIERHIDRCFGPAERWIFHEEVSPHVHVDIHLVPPTDEFPVQRLVTSGMAEAPMTVPADFEATRFAELTIALPEEWPMSQDAFEDERVYWPIRLLKGLARLPHEYSTFLWYGHTVPNGTPPARYADNTNLCCAMIVPPLIAPARFHELDLDDGRRVRFLGVLPIYRDEMRVKLKKGSDALYDLFDAYDVTDLVDPSRRSLAPKRRRLLGL